MPGGDGLDICVWPERLGGRVKLRMGGIRRKSLPMIEDTGAIQDIPLLESQGILEQCHVVFFPDGILGAEFNFYGPRVRKLQDYLADKCDANVPRVSFDLLLRRDPLAQIETLRDISLFHIAIHRADADLLGEADQSLPAALRATADANNAPRLELILRTDPHSRASLGDRMLNVVRNLAGRADAREAAEVFKVKGHNRATGHLEDIDVLKDQLVSVKQVVRHSERSRSFDSGAMFQAIEDAFRKTKS